MSEQEQNLPAEEQDKLRYKAELDLWLEQRKIIFGAAVQLGQNALRGLFILTGGAITVTLGLLGIEPVRDLFANATALLLSALFAFALSATLTVLSSALSYLSQCYYGLENPRMGNIWRNTALAVYALSFMCFFITLFWLGYRFGKFLVL
jgi:hypothetical protein